MAAAPFSSAFSEEHSLSITEICISEGQDSDWSFVRTGGKNGKCIHRALGRADAETSRASGTEGLLLREPLNPVDWNHGQRIQSGPQLPHICGWCVSCLSQLGDDVILPSHTVFSGMLNLPQASCVYLSFRYLG